MPDLSEAPNHELREARPPEIWGVLNLSRDSFSGDGSWTEVEAAVARAKQLSEDGADVIDVGAVSTRPAGKDYGAGAAPVSEEEERARLSTILPALCGAGAEARISVDTRRESVALWALELGVQVINDVGGVPSSAVVAAIASDPSVSYVLTHSRSDGATLGAAACYSDVVDEVRRWLSTRLEALVCAGLAPEQVYLDPGLGFSKGHADSLRVLTELKAFQELGAGLLVGASRKAFLQSVQPSLRALPAGPARDPVSCLAAVHAAKCGVRALRVHDVAGTLQTLALATHLDLGGAGVAS